jgi:hypothetical protein
MAAPSAARYGNATGSSPVPAAAYALAAAYRSPQRVRVILPDERGEVPVGPELVTATFSAAAASRSDS